jgi:hypothetical protein
MRLMGKRGLLREDCCVIDTGNRLMMLKMGSCCSLSLRGEYLQGRYLLGRGLRMGMMRKSGLLRRYYSDTSNRLMLLTMGS